MLDYKTTLQTKCQNLTKFKQKKDKTIYEKIIKK